MEKEIIALEEALELASKEIAKIAKINNIPEALIIQLISAKLGCNELSIDDYIRKNKKPGRVPNWVKKISQLKKQF